MRLTTVYVLYFLIFITIPCDAKQTLIISTEDGPPHMIQKNNSGIDLDITRDVLHLMGFETTVLYAPLERSKIEVAKGTADVTVPTFFTNDGDNLYISKPIIEYKPTVFTLSSNKIKRLADIQGKTVATFQGARGYFSKEFTEMTANNHYIEVADMEKLPTMLQLGRVDVVILDYYIFYYFLAKTQKEMSLKRVYANMIMPSAQASAAFNDKAIRDKFDETFQRYKNDGNIEKVVSKYIGRSSQ
jgi:ABC-type amino acid transport substrate-binding protein